MSFSRAALDRSNEQIRRVDDALSQLFQGKTNNTGDVTLTTSSATTTVSDPRVSQDSTILMMAMDSIAAAEDWYIRQADLTNGQFVINHANAVTTRAFRYVVVG